MGNKILEGLGGFAEQALNLPPTDDTIREKELELEILKLKTKAKEPKQTTLKADIAQKNKPKDEKKRPEPPKVGKKTYMVYLILPENNTAHTNLVLFKTKENNEEHVWFYLEYNKKTYTPDEIIGIGWNKKSAYDGVDGKLTSNGCNYLYLTPEGKIEFFEAKFTPDAQKIIDDTEGMKMNDRAYEKTHYQINSVYSNVDKSMLMFTIVILAFSVCLLAYFMFDGLNKVIGGINGAATSARTPIYAIPLNMTSAEGGGGGAGIGRNFTGNT